MKPKQIDIFSVPVADQQRAKAFYADVLGFKLLRDDPMGPDQRWIQLVPEGAETSITLVSWFEKMPPGSLQGVVLEVEEIEAAQRTLRAKGVAVSEIKSEPWGRYATFNDPDGNGWVLRQASAEA